MVTSCGQDEPHWSPKKAYFSCEIGIYLMSFFYDHPVFFMLNVHKAYWRSEEYRSIKVTKIIHHHIRYSFTLVFLFLTLILWWFLTFNLFINLRVFVNAISVLKKGMHHLLCLFGITGRIFLLPGWNILSTFCSFSATHSFVKS